MMNLACADRLQYSIILLRACGQLPRSFKSSTAFLFIIRLTFVRDAVFTKRESEMI